MAGIWDRHRIGTVFPLAFFPLCVYDAYLSTVVCVSDLHFARGMFSRQT